MNIPTLAACKANNQSVEVLLWVGCAGAFDERYQRVMGSLARLLTLAEVSFAILGKEEQCTGDPARRAGNEFLFEMQALQNIQTLDSYGVKKILASCPHCFNTLKQEYPALGGTYEVLHHSTYLLQLIKAGRLVVQQREASVTYHDPCYLARGNGIVEAPRELLNRLFRDLREVGTHKKQANCCGAGGAQVFKEPEAGTTHVHHNRTKELLDTKSDNIAVACPFCMLMVHEGVQHHQAVNSLPIQDIAQWVEAQVVQEKTQK